VPFTAAQLAQMGPGLAVAAVGDVPVEPVERPCHPQLAEHVIRRLSAVGFDPAASRELPAGRHGNHGIPHGWGFIYQQVLGGAQVPCVPIFVNTFYEPNPPAPARCHEFGLALADAIADYPEPLRVGVVASGGLSHFVVDEDLDRAFLDALCGADAGKPFPADAQVLVSGTAELRNWMVAAAALHRAGLTAQVVDYQPCYRTPAGTGCAMGFVTWQRRDVAAEETRGGGQHGSGRH
ncbi:MAG: hypothetical protein L0Y54_22795, partial [Sporichthyaceae bacterium]|nr:hypothetical protein [Sporichthyaceae bacterium]